MNLSKNFSFMSKNLIFDAARLSLTTFIHINGYKQTNLGKVNLLIKRYTGRLTPPPTTFNTMAHIHDVSFTYINTLVPLETRQRKSIQKYKIIINIIIITFLSYMRKYYVCMKYEFQCFKSFTHFMIQNFKNSKFGCFFLYFRVRTVFRF